MLGQSCEDFVMIPDRAVGKLLFMKGAPPTRAGSQPGGARSKIAGRKILDGPRLAGQSADQWDQFRSRERELVTLMRGRATHGDRNALSLLYDETAGLVYGLAPRLSNDQSAAEQVTMDVYKKVCRSGLNDGPGGTKLPCGLVGVAHLRADQTHHPNKDGSTEARTGSLTHTTSQAISPTKESGTSMAPETVVQAALLALAPEERKVVELACQARLTLDEIAARLPWSVEAVRMRLRTGMTRLRGQLRPLIFRDSV